MVIPAGYAQSTITYSGTGTRFPAAVVMGWDVSGTSLDPLGVAEVIQAWAASTPARAALSNTMFVSGIRVKFGPTATGPDAVVAAPDSTGSLSMERPAANVAVLIRRITALGGRHGRGRNYWPWLGEGNLLFDSSWSSTGTTLAGTAYSALISALASEDVYGVVLHSDPLVPPTEVTGYAVQSVAATQRRRLRR